MSDYPQMKQILEGAILAADQPLSIERMIKLFADNPPAKAEIQEALLKIAEDYEDRGFELKQVASGYRFQVRSSYGEWVSRLWEEKPPRYTRALLETLALIAYKQPLTRGDIEDIRGVSVSTNIIRSLHEREWIRVVGNRDVPGRPALYATTKAFLDYFNLDSLNELPPLSEIRDLDKVKEQLELIEEPEHGRSIELDLNEAVASMAREQAENAEETGNAETEEENLEEVTQKVNEIQENIRSMYREDDSGDADDGDDIDDSGDMDDADDIDDSVGTDDSDDIDDSDDTDDSDDIDDSVGTDDSDDIDDSVGTDDSDDIDDSVGTDDSDDIDDSVGTDDSVDTDDSDDTDETGQDSFVEDASEWTEAFSPDTTDADSDPSMVDSLGESSNASRAESSDETNIVPILTSEEDVSEDSGLDPSDPETDSDSETGLEIERDSERSGDESSTPDLSDRNMETESFATASSQSSITSPGKSWDDSDDDSGVK